MSKGRTDNDLTVRDVEILQQERKFEGYFAIDRYRMRHRKFDGTWSAPFYREVFERGHAVVVVLYDADRDLLVMIEQFRPGAYVALQGPHPDGAFTPWLVEWVAGIIDPGETPEGVARREAIEEAGCEISNLEFLQPVLATPGGSSETLYFFVGQVDAPETGRIHGLDDEDEDIRLIVVSPEEAFKWLDDCRIVNASTIIGLQWFRQIHHSLRQRWRKSLAPAQ